MAKTFSKDEVASHSKGDSLWIVIDEDVYDVSKFQDEHPGKPCAGDVTASIQRESHANEKAHRWEKEYVMAQPRDHLRY